MGWVADEAEQIVWCLGEVELSWPNGVEVVT